MSDRGSRFADHGWELVGAERVDRQFELWGCRLRRLDVWTAAFRERPIQSWAAA